MRIAVTYDNGEVFQHFGKTRSFKLYDVDNGEVQSSEILDCGDTGHEALAGLLAENGVNAVICGGLGGGAQAALSEAGIEVCSGASGDADEALRSYLAGDLVNSGVNCDHHDHHHEEEESLGCESGCGSEGGCGHDCDSEEGCGSDCEGGCGGCGGGCGGCGGHLEVILDGRNAGKTCRVHYKGTFNDGTQFDSSYDRGEPLEFICGTGMMIKGFDEAVVDMNEGDEIDVHLMPEDAYGMPDPNAVMTMKIAELPGSENLNVGDQAYLSGPMGRPVLIKVTDKTDDTIVLDANHEMAGKELNFHIELVSVAG